MLSKHFNVIISDNPDFLICSNRGTPFEYMKYDCVRIMFMGENLSPDFTVFDYVIGFDYLEFGDRYFRLPFGLFFNEGKPWIPEKLSREQAEEILNQKKYFCNFIYGHQSSHGMREKLFKELEKYKSVVSPGSYLNNANDSKKRCSWQEKYSYVKASKFTIAGDSIRYPGFVTEKIVQPFQNHSIPIYFGSTRIYEDFNKEALSVEDKGAGICFNVFCYNVQPQIEINYADGTSRISTYDATSDTEPPVSEVTYILNRNSKKFHYPDCTSVNDMKEKNRISFYGSRDEAIALGYSPCKRCNP